ncbi:MAG: FAD-dependent oxidoreductase [Gammaproteobacteria bacterium]|nr:FAD-dependent oxidoreductase [Gammaproteobacteria bacterium]MCY4358220.1 FAD-dependent oxidoreductase [Gammaproteobacteria bacterium]
MSDQTCLVIGASHAGVSLALTLRKEGWAGPIKLISEEKELPYHRPPLSKEHLAGKKDLDGMRLRPSKIYDDNAIELLLGTAATGIDRKAKSVILASGEVLAYDKLALCIGASVRKLPIGQGLERVHYLRTAADVKTIKSQLPSVGHAVIIGGGYIGLEVAAVLRSLDLNVTVLEMEDRVLSRVTSSVLSDYMNDLHTSHGVTIATSCRVTAIRPGQDVESPMNLECEDGDVMQADMVFIGVGVQPNVGLAYEAGLEVGDGIVVDAHACSSDPDIYAAGDCSWHRNNFYESEMRLESVQNANDQARVAAANLCGKRTVYNALPWFWSDQYDVKLQMVGLNNQYDQLIIRGDPKDHEKGFALLYLKEGKLVAADCIRRPKEYMVSKQLIPLALQIDPALLADINNDPACWREAGDASRQLNAH